MSQKAIRKHILVQNLFMHSLIFFNSYNQAIILLEFEYSGSTKKNIIVQFWLAMLRNLLKLIKLIQLEVIIYII
jgi:hypothetical protein